MKVNSHLRSIFFSTVFIDVVKTNGARLTGTGFTYITNHRGRPVPLLVTARHVVSDALTGSIRFIEAGEDGTPRLGQTVDYKYADFSSHWYSHPDSAVDIAVKPALHEINAAGEPGRKQPFFRLIDKSLMPTLEQVDKLDLLEGVTFVGYPAGLYDTANFTPVMVQGTAATPLEIDWQEKPVFLINAPVVTGLSGSPVFAVGDGMYRERGGNTIIGNRLLFLGILTGGYQVSEKGTINKGDEQSSFSFMNKLNLGAVHKWTAVIDTVDRLLNANT